MANSSRKLSTSSIYLITLSVVPVFFLTHTIDVFNISKALLFIALVVGTLVHFKILNSRRTFSNFEKKVSLILLFLIGGILTTSLLSDTTLARMLWGYPGRANGLLYYGAVFVSLYIGMRLTLEESFPKRLKRACNFSFIVVTAYSLIQYLGLDPIAWSNSTQIIGTFGNSNFISAYLGVITSFYLFQFLETRNSTRYIFLILSLIAGFLTVETDSIQGIALIAIATTILILRYTKQHVSIKIFLLSLISTIIFGSFFFISFLGFGPLGESLYQYTLRLRMDYWAIGIKTGLNWPLTGVGTDSYIEGFKLLRDRDFVEKWGHTLTSDSAHSVPLNFLANFGFINFALYLTLLIVISTLAIKVLFGSRQVRSFAPLVALMWSGMVIQSLFSIEQIGLSSFQWLLGGILLNEQIFEPIAVNRKIKEESVSKSLATPKRKWFYEFRGEIALASVVLSTFLLSPIIREDINLKKLSLISNNQSSLIEFLDSNANSFSYITRDEVRKGVRLSNALLDAGRVSDAETFLLKMVEKDPQAFDALETLARIQNYYSRPQQEVFYRKRVERVDPWNYANRLALVSAYISLGRVSEAESSAELLLKLAPNSTEAESATALIREIKDR